MRTVLHTIALAVLVLASRTAHAQYKNSSFGIDAGGWLIQKPSVVDEDGKFKAPDNRPLRLSNGLRIGGESNFKMRDDHFWFIARVNLGFLQFPKGSAKATENDEDSLNQQFDFAAHKAMGTLLGIQGSIGVRYLFATDYVRPYMQLSLSYLRLMSFSDESACEDDFVCGGTDDNEAAFLPHPNVGGVHVQPGVEIIFTRDMALHIFADLQRWIVFNADDNNAVVIGGGIIFYT
jgi:hypothetical protein